jgi:hypothetical protein
VVKLSKAKQIDAINDAFIKVLSKENASAFTSYIKAINKELIDNIDNLTPQKVKSIIDSHTPNITSVALLFTIQNAIIQIINAPRQAKNNASILPVLAILGIYSLRNPTKFVERIVKINKTAPKNLTGNQLKVKELLGDFKQTNAEVLANSRKQAIIDINKSIKKSKISKRMLRDYQQDLKDNKSLAHSKRKLQKKYNNKANIERALDTELHRASETIRQEHAIDLGYTHKTWKTQNDSKVRETCFHKAIKNKRVPIDSDFRACGMKAQRPSDDRLPPNESIRCRCYLIFD